MKMHSNDALLVLRRQASVLDFIYIDAYQVAINVLHDAVICWRMLSPFGTTVFNECSWKGYMEGCYNPRIAIETFLHCAAPEEEYEETVWVKKVLNKISPTPNPDPDLNYWDKGLAKNP